jgi:hypothetical protein
MKFNLGGYVYLLLKYSHETLVDDREPGRFVKKIKGSIVNQVDDVKTVKIGQFSVIVIDVESAVNERESTFEIFDYSSRTIDYYDFYTPDMDFKPKVLAALPAGERWAPNMLVLERLEILPKYRGQGAGLRVLRWLHFHFGMGCGIVVMKPYPLQFEGGQPHENVDDPMFKRLRLGTFTTDFEPARKKLRDYYGRLGFKLVKGTEYMVADPFFAVRSLEEIGLED